ncbi:acyl homoserine lactone synthase [Chelatococcus caeni]|uniref:Acyl-homoserine-lactone synthase n=1 Tax=Chelatococcus caeni TaxID=1348468 RepID=A0A840BUG6_9HYPH|nr:acyl-homoserine-lactone synthase [Chelatococcus caeni]MBB4015029.1 acyl homoserine lactone synthase [Chelatococcus caeni]
MLHVISNENAHLHWDALASMHQLRRAVFSERLGWSVTVVNGLELDQFDLPEAHYLVHYAPDGRVNACTRLLPTTGPYLLADVFPELVDGEMPRAHDIWESTRFCADQATAPGNIAAVLMAGMLEFGLFTGLRAYVSVSDIRMEPIMRHAGWNPVRLGGTMETGTDTAAAEWLEVSPECLSRVRHRAGAAGPTIANLDEIDQGRVAA